MKHKRGGNETIVTGCWSGGLAGRALRGHDSLVLFMTLTEERLAQLRELEHPEALQRVLAAVYLFCNLPVLDLARCTPRQIKLIAEPVKGTCG